MCNRTFLIFKYVCFVFLLPGLTFAGLSLGCANYTTELVNKDSTSSTASCDQIIPVTSGISDSSPSAVSHNPGQDCLSACHGQTGTATAKWAFAGTVYPDKNLSLTAAGPGINVMIMGINPSINMTTDQCGNFYTKTLAAYDSASPMVGANTMIQFLNETNNDNNCNKFGCHSIGARIY